MRVLLLKAPHILTHSWENLYEGYRTADENWDRDPEPMPIDPNQGHYPETDGILIDPRLDAVDTIPPTTGEEPWLHVTGAEGEPDLKWFSPYTEAMAERTLNDAGCNNGYAFYATKDGLWYVPLRADLPELTEEQCENLYHMVLDWRLEYYREAKEGPPYPSRVD